MDVRIRFPFSQPIYLEDCWPLTGSGAHVEFERDGDEVKAIVVTFHNQPVNKAPEVTKLTHGPAKMHFKIGGGYESIARTIVRRFSDFVNLYFSISIATDEVEVDYIPANEQERSEIRILNIKSSRFRPKLQPRFSILAQAFFAGESSDNPSFASHLAKRARDAMVDHQYIDSFRYGFLLFEALYGNGKFKKPQLVAALAGNAEFTSFVSETMSAFKNDPLYRSSKAKEIINQYPTTEALIEFLVDRRGRYFHGNLARKDAWHPDNQDEAKELAEICVDIAAAVAHSFASAMFTSEVSRRHFENAQEQGAILTVKIQFSLKDENGLTSSGTFNINMPATKVTNSLAVAVNKHFLEWAETELHGKTLVSAVALDEETNTEIFRSQYFNTALDLEHKEKTNLP